MSKKMSIDGVFAHVHAIIDQGREEEFLEACKAQGFETLTGPDGLIAFTRQFLAAASTSVETPNFSDVLSTSSKAILGKSLGTKASKIDICGC